MTVQKAIKYWKIFLKEIAFLKREHSSIDWEEQEQATKWAIEALEKQIAVNKVIDRLEVESNFFGGEPMGTLQKTYYCKGIERAIEIIKEEMM